MNLQQGTLLKHSEYRIERELGHGSLGDTLSMNRGGVDGASSHLVREIKEHEYVDLGLSVKWATCNVGASLPSDFGDHYAWGETSTKRSYTEDNYKYYKNGRHIYIGSNISGTQYDAARVNWGGTWRMPTFEEIRELLDKCTWERITLNEHKGYRVTGPNGKSIFLPDTHHTFNIDDSYIGAGRYWSATIIPDSNETYELYLNSYERECDEFSGGGRFAGCSIRPVTD